MFEDTIRRWASMKATPVANTAPTSQQPAQKQYFMRIATDPTEAEIAALTDRTSKTCPFHNYVGNDTAVKRLCRLAKSALMSGSCNDIRIALLGPASTGKTSLAKKFAATMKFPFADIHPTSVKNVQEFFAEVIKKLRAEGCIIDEAPEIELPDCLIFIDEVHSLPNAVVQGLLKATEQNDGLCDTGQYIVNCKKVGWVIATTDRGLLFDAFDTRFAKLFLKLYSEAEISQIVANNYPDWNAQTCDLVAKFGGRYPREVLAFAEEMLLEARTSGSNDWAAIAKIVATDNDIDAWGMRLQYVQILKALHERGAIPKARMCDVAGCKTEELERFVMPVLLSVLPDRGALIEVSSKGYVLTETGLEQLRLRGLV